MAYEISSSVKNSTFSVQALTASFSGTFERGMSISPDGTMAAANAYRHGASDPGSTDYGINIYMSSSGTGWAFDHSIDAGSYLPIALKWRTNSELWGIQNNRMSNWTSSSSGWAAGSVYAAGLTTGGKSAWRFNPSKTMLALWKGGASAPVVIYSGSAGGTSWSNSDVRSITISGITNDAEGFAWAGDVDFIVGDHTYNSNRGRVVAMRSSDDGGSWSYNTGELMNGASSTTSGKHQLGIWLWYHTGSNTLLVQGAQNDSQSIYNRIWYWQSSSAEGYIPASDNSLVELTRSYSPLLNSHTSHQEGNGDAILSIENFNASYPDQQTVVIETGSSGWSVTKVGNPARNVGSEGQISLGPSSAGGIISVPGDVSGGSNPAVNRFFGMIASNPSLDASVTSTVGTSGGTVKAGGTENSPTITVTVGSGDLDGDTSLTAAVISDESVKAQNLTAIKKEAGSAGAHFVGDIVRLTPHGTEFNSAVQVQFELDSAPADLTIWKRDSHDGDHTQWYQLPSTYWSASGTTITINTTRFSEYAGLGGINVARTKLSNSQLATLTTTDLVASTSIQISGSSNSFKDRTVAGDDLFLIEDKSNGTTYHVSASQMAEYFGGLVNVSASSDNVDMRMTFVSPTDNADIGLAVDAGIKYNPSSNTLKGTNLSGSGDLTIAGNATIDDNIIATKGYIQIADDNLHVTGNVLSSGLIKGTTLSGSGDLTIAGSATIDDNVVLTKGYVQVAADNVHVTGAVLASGDIKGANLSGSGDLTIAGSATIDDNVVLTKGYLQVADDNAFISGSTRIKLPASGQFVVRDSSGNDEFKVDENGDLTAGTLTYDTSANTLGINSVISLNGTTGLVSGSNLVSAGNVTADDNIIATKGYVQVKAGNIHVTGNVLAQEVKGTAISGSGNLTIAGAATIAGSLTVNGDLTYINTTNLAVEDSLILLGSGSSGTPVNDQGFILERGDSANAAVVFDESTDRFVFAYVGTASAGSTGNLDVALGAPVSASAFYGDGSNLTGVGAATVASNNDNNELALTFVSGAGLAAATLFTDASVLKYNTSTDTLKSVAFSASSTITAKGIISGSSHLRIAGDTDFAGTLDVVGLISGSGGIDIGGAADFGSTVKAQGNISGSSDLTIAGSATVDDNVVLTKGYLQVKADNMHITGNVLSSGLIKGTTLSGSGDLTIAGSATIDDNLILTKGYVQIKASELNVTGGIKASSVISGSSHLQIAGNTDLAGTLDVVGLISGSGGIDIGGTADFGAAVNIQGALDVDGNTTVDVFTASDTATFNGAVNLGDSGADAIVVSGALDVGSQNTKFRSNQVEFLNLDSMAVDSNDSTHFLLVQDSDNNYIKKEAVTDFVQHITGAAGTRGGLQVHQGKLHIVQKEESFMSASLTGNAHTASLSGPVLSGSLMVFLNGLLQTRSGSANLGAGANSIFDYRLDSYTAPTKVLMADALDSDDVLIVRYVQK